MAMSTDDSKFTGYLCKWTNYFRGYQKRYFVVYAGEMSYYKSETEVSETCRGAVMLLHALIYEQDDKTFVIESNGGSQIFYLRADSSEEKEWWMTMLQLAKAKAISQAKNEEKKQDNPLEKLTQCEETNKDIKYAITNLLSCSKLIGKYGNTLILITKSITTSDKPEEITEKLKEVSEIAAMIKVASAGIVDFCDDQVNSATKKKQEAAQPDQTSELVAFS